MATKKAAPEPEEMQVPGMWEEVAPGKVTWRNGHAKEICAECGEHPLDRSTTGWTCEHVTVAFTKPEVPADSVEVKEVTLDMMDDQIRAMIAKRDAMAAAQAK